jgi:dTDP-4-dehydrorhamnose reductase
MRVLIFGATGMLGSTLFRYLSLDSTLEVFATVRSHADKHFGDSKNLIRGINIENPSSLVEAFIKAKPDVVVNCIGLVKQLSESTQPLKALLVNAQLPHQLSELCKLNNSRLILISTDCVFSGKKGNYTEQDFPDAKDLYGRSKLLGEVDEPHALTLRTSIIGHELESKKGLLEWFLSQRDQTKGFNKAIFSGLPTIELSKVIKNMLHRPDLSGLYHVSSEAINKYDLLCLIAKIYNKTIHIVKDDNLIIDRSMNSARFSAATGYVAPSWPELISAMHATYTRYNSGNLILDKTKKVLSSPVFA